MYQDFSGPARTNGTTYKVPASNPSTTPLLPAAITTASPATTTTAAAETTSVSVSSAKSIDDNSDERKLFIGGLSWETKEPQLLEYFSQFGEVESVNLKLDPVSGRSRCFAFLVFKDISSVDKVIDGREHALSSKKIDVKKAKAKSGKIFVGGLTPELEENAIREHFLKFGAITELEIPWDKVKEERKNFCFVTFEREETMKEVIKTRKQTISQVEVDVKKATPRPKGGRFGGPDYYSGMDSYYGYNSYWYGAAPSDGGGGGGKVGHDKTSNKFSPY